MIIKYLTKIIQINFESFEQLLVIPIIPYSIDKRETNFHLVGINSKFRDT